MKENEKKKTGKKKKPNRIINKCKQNAKRQQAAFCVYYWTSRLACAGSIPPLACRSTENSRTQEYWKSEREREGETTVTNIYFHCECVCTFVEYYVYVYVCICVSRTRNIKRLRNFSSDGFEH